MIHYIQVGDNGRILNAGSSSGFKDEETFLAEMPDAVVMPFPGTNPFQSYWDGTAVVDMGIGMTPYHVFDYATKTWVDPRTLSEMKFLKWAEVKQARNLAEFGNFTYNGMVFDGDVDAQRRLAGYISISKGALAAGTAFEAPFTLANNTEVVLTAQDFVGIELAKVTSVATAFAQAAALRLQIDAVTSIGQLALINWNNQP